MSPSCTSIDVGGARGEVMYVRTIHIIAERARGRPKPMAGGAPCGGEVMTPTGKPPQTHRGRREVE